MLRPARAAGLHACPRAACDGQLEVVQDRLRLGSADRARVIDALESALRVGRGRVSVQPGEPADVADRCGCRQAACRVTLALFDRPALRRLRHPLPRTDAEPVLVQLAARRLRDLPRLRPRHRHRLRARDPGRRQDAARRRGAAVADRVLSRVPGRPAQVRPQARHPVDVPWRELTDEQQRWVIEGEGPWDKKIWYGVRRFFEWLESRATRCTCACCSRSTAATRRAPTATARG